MTNVTVILNAIEQGDAQAADKLLPLVYEELRRLAARKMSHELPGQTLQATALVHEAYIRLVEARDQKWNSRGHFFRAAAEAMRRILVENARKKKSLKHGGNKQRVELGDSILLATQEICPDDIVLLSSPFVAALNGIRPNILVECIL
jgi:RNA polymerase sigma factor (TIGR02999 family)